MTCFPEVWKPKGVDLIPLERTELTIGASSRPVNDALRRGAITMARAAR